MTATVHCPDCGSLLPPDAPQGECPRCLLRVGYESEPAGSGSVPPTRTSAGRTTFTPPSIAELQPRFPQYEILELIGQGGMGAVYKARQAGLGRLVAIKILPVEVSQSAAFTERFAREARALALLSHPHIVGVHDFGQAEGLCYFVMEYVDGVNLRQALQAGKMTPQQALAIVPQICEALQFAHEEGVVHRDIKPENILLDKRGRVKIADFGLAKLLGVDSIEQSLTGTQQVMGTLRYMAPEQMFGSKEVDHRADIFSLGVVFYELLTGELPVGRFAPPSKKSGVDVRLDEVVLRALESEPEERYQSVSEMKLGLDSISKVGLPAALPPPQASSPSPARPTLEPRAAANDGFAGSVWHLLVAAGLSLTTLWFVLYTAGPVITMIDGPDTPLLRLGADWRIGTGVEKVMSVLTVMFIALVAATIYAWWTYRTAVIARNPPQPGNAFTNTEPRLSQAALWGAIFSPFFILGVCLLVVATIPAVVLQRVDANSPPPAGIPIGFLILLGLLELACIVSPFVTTLLGIVAIGSIRRSKGKVYGVPLAVFDALLYPLLLLDLLIFVLGYAVVLLANSYILSLTNTPEKVVSVTWIGSFVIAAALFGPLIILLDIWLIRLCWRAATQGLDPKAPANEFDLPAAKLPLTKPPPFQPQRSPTSSVTVVFLVLVGLLAIPTLLGCGVLGVYFLKPISATPPQRLEIESPPWDVSNETTRPDVEKFSIPATKGQR